MADVTSLASDWAEPSQGLIELCEAGKHSPAVYPDGGDPDHSSERTASLPSLEVPLHALKGFLLPPREASQNRASRHWDS